MTKIKICGITNLKDAMYSATLGADYLGFNFYKKSERKISVKMASEIISKLAGFVQPVGVFVDEEIENVVNIATQCPLKLIQLHGRETPEYCTQLYEKCPLPQIKAFKIKGEGTLRYISQYKDSPFSYFLLDAYAPGEEGGTGETFNWDIALRVQELFISKPLFLAGGLMPENVKEAIEKVHPYAVDVASGVERLPRRKDYEKLKQFIVLAKSV
ncbi:MAG: hypothetical protein AUJ85_05570 [Elusimicrobia bacterium CG1_02_37_114]|nr:MAG: hypothetical protein AUJ85_05570 [Elusimicrobia bacterium CG1_02_37_114]PIV53238.1 MAG: phosphoribosylanthranilate isomerase [Elusimicrobia bacterium CG02_land_8_20_14_3_00_37_13]PIZ12540.1 MAG: phosphoribosylanthranilate isomerase [Elusimicrobia bacterium CG_4_10_14_0_8_um_filter_37_32]